MIQSNFIQPNQDTEEDDQILGSLGDDEIYGDPLSDTNYQYEVGSDDAIYGDQGSDRIWGRLDRESKPSYTALKDGVCIPNYWSILKSNA